MDRRRATTTLAFHASRIVIDLGVLLVLGSMSVSYVNSPTGARSGVELDALPALLLLAPVFAVTLLPDHTRPLPRQVSWGALVLGLAAFPYSLVKYLDATVLADTLGGSLGLGVRLLVFGAFTTLVGIGIGLTRSWLGLPSGGALQRTAAVSRTAPAANPAPAPRPRPRPARATTEQSPFGDPLFDSLEVPETRADEAPLRQAGLVLDSGAAAERHASDEPDSAT